jgi:uncharacterized membrane protein
VGWGLTGNPIIGLSIGTVDFIIKLFIYYGHETIWEKKMARDIRQIKLEYDENN